MEPDMCRNGLHDKNVTGLNGQGKCLMCARLRGRRAQASPSGVLAHRRRTARYERTSKGKITKALMGLRYRRKARIARMQSLQEELAS